MMNYQNPYFNPQQAQAPYQPTQNQNPYYQAMPGYYPPVPGGYYQPAPQEQQPETGWQKAGKVALDLLKIGVAVCGGVAVYKLAENYFGEDDCCCGTTAATESSKSTLYSGREEVFDD